jgi:hypothetical protein
LGPDHQRELEELKQSAVKRFKHLKYLELTKEIKSQRNKDSLFLLKAKLRALNYDPETQGGGAGSQEPEMGDEEIQSKARALLSLFEDKESQLMVEDLEASMLCEVSRLNLLTFLKVFQVELHLEPELGSGDGSGDGKETENQMSPEEAAQLISGLRGEVKTLSEQVIVLRSEKIVQV